MNDNDILIYFCGKGLKHINHKKFNSIPKKINDYLINRYSDSFSAEESVIRILHKIDVHPVCPICGNPCKLHKYKHKFLNTCENNQCIKMYSIIKRENTMLEKYGYKNSFENKEILNKAINNTQTEISINKRKDKYYSKTKEEQNIIKSKRKQTKLERYGDENYVNSNKSKQTKLERYGDENYINLNKSKQTKLERYGDENYINIEKIKQTNLERYGYEMPFQSKEIINKIHNDQINKYGCLAFNSYKQKQTCLEKYGVDNVFKSEEIKKKIKKTRYNHFGQYQSFKQIEKSKSEEVKEKRYETQKINNTLNSSKTELESYDLLKEKYPDILHHYKDKKRYPFACDFYIPSLDLFIECQYGQFHNIRPYLNTEEDKKEIELLKQKSEKRKQITGKNKSRYDAVIYTWSDLDVRKRNIAKQNNLNYIEFWNINELKDWLNQEFNIIFNKVHILNNNEKIK